MRILIVRHCDPNYAIDSLTEKGWREAEMLTERLAKEKIDAYYVSPLGRAKATASLILKQRNETAEECPWLREFAPIIEREIPNPNAPNSWDWLPEEWMRQEILFDRNRWSEQPAMVGGKVGEEYNWVAQGLDSILAKHGYVREGSYYRAERPNTDTIALFCHFGVECVLLSHLMNVSPMILWHHFCAAPSSVTTLYTEERREGIATFRATSMGDLSHLYAHGEQPSFAARFCETFDSPDRHD